MSAAVVRANALRLPLADESVDLVVTSPPYFALRSYRDEGEHYSGQVGSEETPQAFLEALWAVTAECHRVLKPSGSAFFNLGDKYAGSGGHNNSAIGADPDRGPSRYNQETSGIRAKSLMGLPWRFALGCIDGQAAPDGQRWILRAEVIWSKPNGLPESVTDRVRRSHEQWFHLVRSPRYFSAVDEVREAYEKPDVKRSGNKLDASEYRATGSRNGITGSLNRDASESMNPLGKLPGSVWNIPSEPLLIPEAVQRHYDLPDHFAAFPQELPRRIILGWSPNGVCVECGEGRRPVVAKELRNGSRPIPSGYEPRGRWGLKGQSADTPLPSRLGDGIDATITGYTCACNDECPDCEGLGDCPVCYGEEGGCGVCHLTGRCQRCNGTGRPPPTTPAVVLDPFGGTGTTAMVARTLGRFGVSVDLSADYNRLARWRIWESGHGEKAAQRTHRENQGDLFGNAPTYEDVEVKEAL